MSIHFWWTTAVIKPLVVVLFTFRVVPSGISIYSLYCSLDGLFGRLTLSIHSALLPNQFS